MTLLSTNDYIYGVVGLIYGLRDIAHTEYPITVLVTDDIKEENINILNRLNVEVIHCDRLIPSGYDKEQGVKDLVSLTQPGYHMALSKLNIFGMTEYEKIVYIDSDMYIRSNIDDLFDKPDMSAVEDVFGTVSDKFCSGLIVIEPNKKRYNDLMNFFYNFKTENETDMIHDQLVLQKYFTEWGNDKELHLDNNYSMWTTAFTHSEFISEYFNNNKVKAYHIIDKKP